MANPAQPEKTVTDGSIDFNHVNFSYKHGSGEETLQDIDLHIRSGETIGIIGGTGSGKSSLVSLISRLYKVLHVFCAAAKGSGYCERLYRGDDGRTEGSQGILP